jgi:hypothetical protein
MQGVGQSMSGMAVELRLRDDRLCGAAAAGVLELEHPALAPGLAPSIGVVGRCANPCTKLGQRQRRVREAPTCGQAEQIAHALSELPRDVAIVADGRGPFCPMSDEAMALLMKRGFSARKAFDGVSEWQAAGLPVTRP